MKSIIKRLEEQNIEQTANNIYNQALKDVKKLIKQVDYIEVHNFLNNKEELMISARKLKQKLKELSK